MVDWLYKAGRCLRKYFDTCGIDFGRVATKTEQWLLQVHLFFIHFQYMLMSSGQNMNKWVRNVIWPYKLMPEWI